MSLKSEGPRLNPSSTFSDSVTWARCSPNLLSACKSRFINTVRSFEFCVRGSAELSLAASSPGGKKGRSLWCLRSAASDQLSALWRVRMARASPMLCSRRTFTGMCQLAGSPGWAGTRCPDSASGDDAQQAVSPPGLSFPREPSPHRREILPGAEGGCSS